LKTSSRRRKPNCCEEEEEEEEEEGEEGRRHNAASCCYSRFISNGNTFSLSRFRRISKLLVSASSLSLSLSLCVCLSGNNTLSNWVGFIKLHLITDKREGSKTPHFWWAGWIVANYCLNFPNNCFRKCSAHRLKGKQ
jgi:hypothetical protein